MTLALIKCGWLGSLRIIIDAETLGPRFGQTVHLAAAKLGFVGAEALFQCLQVS